MPLSAGDQLGSYTILSLVGKGGMGEVYRAHDARLRRDVAIKVSRDQFTERFTREARAIASLNHTNVCHLYDVGPNYLVMEYVEGEDLKGPLTFDEALPIVRQLIDGIEAAHEKNVIHRDLKPANVKITPEGVVKILDFGLAKAADEAVAGDPSEAPTLTMGGTVAGTILGTGAYMSPEQAKGKAVDKRADIWSFGVVLYELLTGKKLFTGESVVEVLGAVLNKDPDISAAPARVHRLLRWCLEKDRKNRLASISDARRMLEEGGTESPAQAASLPYRNSKAPWLVAGAFAIAAAALAFWPKPVPELQALRYTIDPPPGFQFTNPFGTGTPSPDGRFLVFAAAPVSSTGTSARTVGQSLWLRPTDSLEARPLPGTENGGFPFWSPDGKSIGFWTQADRKLKRIEAVGGAAQVLCDASNFDGGTWSKDGIILFSAGSVIRRVAAVGGKPELVTKRDVRRQENHTNPQFLPDGQSFLYRIVSADEKVTGIYAATLTEPDSPVRLVAGTERKAVYAPPFEGRPGYLLWLREQTLVAQRFDAAALKLEGDPIPVAEEVAMQPGGNGRRAAAFWISQNGLLSYRTGTIGGGAIQMTWVSRDGKQREPVGQPGDFNGYLRFSPDGKRVAVARTVAGNTDIWLYEFARGLMSRLTFDPAVEGDPNWSPDGRHVTYFSTRHGPPQMYRKDAGGAGEEERLHESQLGEYPTGWSPDGKFLLYTSIDPKTSNDQWLLPMEGSAARKPVLIRQTPFAEGVSQVSPDGKWIAYQSSESGRSEVYVRSMPTGNAGQPAGQWQVSTGGGQQPRWRADGKELYYHEAGDGQAVMAANIKLLSDRVEIETPRELFRYGGAVGSYEPAPDGQRFLVLTSPADDDDSGAGALKIVSNWQALLK